VVGGGDLVLALALCIDDQATVEVVVNCNPGFGLGGKGAAVAEASNTNR